MIDIPADEYAKMMQAEIAARKSKKKGPSVLREHGKEHTFFTKPFRVISKNAGFEMTGKGHPEAKLTGARPPRPDKIVQDTKEDKEGTI